MIVEDGDHILRRKSFREGGEAAQVAEERGDFTLLAAQYRFLAAGRHIAHDLLGRVARERAQAGRDARHGVFELGDLAQHRPAAGRLL